MSNADASQDGSKPTEYRQFRFSLPPGATDLLLVRHGESQPARLDAPFATVDGHADPPLDPRGQEEAKRVALRLSGEPVAAIYVTTLQRTAQTAAPLAASAKLTPQIEPDLREVHLGEWEGGVFRAKVSEGDPIARKMFEEERWDLIPGAETNDQVTARVRGAIERLAAAHRDQRVVAFTHGGIVATVAALATGSRPFAFMGADNASITHLVVTEERWILRRFNDTGHLATDLDRAPDPLT